MVDRDRAEGVLLGLACGDALGRPVEGWSADRIDREYGTLESFVGDGTHGESPGTVTDDTQLATLLARSLVACDGFDRDDFVSRLVDWYERRPFGIGGTTTEALRRIADGTPPLEAAGAAREAKPRGEKATNGSVMRCAPLAIAYADDREALEGGERPLETALAELSADAPAELVEGLEPVPDAVDSETLVPANDAVETLRTALWHALTASDPEAAIVGAVDEGGDADTVGAVAGAVAGARFGANALPDRWLSSVEGRAERSELAGRLVELEPADP